MTTISLAVPAATRIEVRQQAHPSADAPTGWVLTVNIPVDRFRLFDSIDVKFFTVDRADGEAQAQALIGQLAPGFDLAAALAAAGRRGTFAAAQVEVPLAEMTEVTS